MLISKVYQEDPPMGPYYYNMFMNDMFQFNERRNVYDYADDNSMSTSAKSADEAIALVIADCKNAVNWFTSNGMKANLRKFQFMIASPHDRTERKPELLDN